MIKKYNEFLKSVNESQENDEGFTKEQLYEEGANAIIRAARFLGNEDLENEDPSTVIDALKDNGTPDAMECIEEIESYEEMISNFPSGEETCLDCDGDGCDECDGLGYYADEDGDDW